MNPVPVDKTLVSYCWLYCGACEKYLDGKCPGCRKKEKSPFWCGIRNCCIEKGIEHCVDCNEHPNNARTCKKYNGLTMKVLGYLCGSDRFAAYVKIKELGTQKFAEEMAEKGIMRIGRKNIKPLRR